jgi:hypothetical protein
MTDTTEISQDAASTLSRQVLFSLALARGDSIRDASKAAKVSEATGYRWAGLSNVAEMTNEYRMRIVRESIGRVAAMGERATSRLAELIESKDEAIALKASLAAISEIRRVADQTDGAVYRTAVPMPPTDPEPYVPPDPSDWSFLVEDMVSGSLYPELDEPLTDDLDRNAKESEKRRHKERCGLILDRNAQRREAKRKYESHRLLIEAEAEAVDSIE